MEADVQRKIKELESEFHSLNDKYKTLLGRTETLEKKIKENLEEELEVPVVVWKETEDAKLPERKKEGDIGYDAYLNEDKIIKAHTAEKVSLGIGMGIPKGFGVHSVNRGGNYLGKTYGSPIDVGEPWVDNNYRGIINALIQNNGDNDIEVHKGDRVCSVNVYRTYAFKYIPLEDYLKEHNITKEEYFNTNRGATGFGNSGIK